MLPSATSVAPGASARSWPGWRGPSSPTRAARRSCACAATPGSPPRSGPVRPPCAELCRTNAGLFEAAVRGRDRVHVVGGVEPLAQLVLGGWRLYLGEQVPKVPSLARFRGWE